MMSEFENEASNTRLETRSEIKEKARTARNQQAF
jgi:hypothetical protein